MATIYPLNNFSTSSSVKGVISSNSTNYAAADSISSISGNSNNLSNVSVSAEKVIQSYNLRFVSQDQIDKWDSVYKSVEENNAISYKWYQTFKITSEDISNNYITLPNNKTFFDYDSKSLLIFVNDEYISPNKYVIVNSKQFYFKPGFVKSGDTVNILHFNKANRISNYDTRSLAMAAVWSYSYKNESADPMDVIRISPDFSLINPDKYSLLVYIDGLYISPEKYEIEDTTRIRLINDTVLGQEQNIEIIQLARVLPNNEYIGFVWGETINVDTTGNTFNLSPNHAFSNVNDKSVLIFIDSKINRDYTIVNSNTIKFNDAVISGSKIDMIQLGFTADINKIKDILDSNNLENIINFNIKEYVKDDLGDMPGGFARINQKGYINTNIIDIDSLVELIKAKLDYQQWCPEAVGVAQHTHDNLDVLNNLKAYNNYLYYGDIPVGDPSEETTFVDNLTTTQINNAFLELPEDCDANRPIILSISGVTQTRDIDFTTIIRELPLKDIITWKGYEMQDRVMVGDRVTITYYKKKTSTI